MWERLEIHKNENVSGEFRFVLDEVKISRPATVWSCKYGRQIMDLQNKVKELNSSAI